LKKVQEELDEKVGKDRLVKESDIEKLAYLQAVVKETLRLYAAGPLSVPREFTRDCSLGGYRIAAGTRLMLNIWKLHRDPRVWSEESEFRPERFLGAHQDVDVKGKHFVLMPFGGGRRACPGISFGLQMTHLALAALLQAFDVTTPSNSPVDMSATFGLTNAKTNPLEVLLKPRLPLSLYPSPPSLQLKKIRFIHFSFLFLGVAWQASSFKCTIKFHSTYLLSKLLFIFPHISYKPLQRGNHTYNS